MALIVFIGISSILLFAGVIAFGAPYLPTLNSRVEDALDLLDLKSGQTMLELGSGDGRMLRAAATRGIKSIGYELNPLLVIYSYLRCIKYRGLITIRWGNYWAKDWPQADGMYVFLLQPYMTKLHNKVTHYVGSKRFNLVSFAFKIEQKHPVAEQNGMFLYRY